MEKFFDWLMRKPDKKGWLLLYLFILCIFCNVAGALLMTWLKVDLHLWSFGVAPDSPKFLRLIQVMIYLMVVEEVQFRLIPLGLTVAITNNRTVLTAVAIVTSALFGYLHGGVSNIFLQGASGLVLSICFLKYGGIRKKYLDGFLYSTLLHIALNGHALLLSLIHTGKV